ncbi:hypothetical protein EW145_g8313, partial [Phellinidium pouzarii]
MASKENTPTPSRQRSPIDNADFDRVFGSPSSATLLTADGERPRLMLSPPPEEELRSMRRTGNNEPGSASKPLASSLRSNQFSLEPSSKRKRTRTENGSLASSPLGVSRTLEQEHEHEQAQGHALHTPNPRLRKQVRHAVLSPSPSAALALARRADASLLLKRDGSPDAWNGDDASMMSPTRKGKSHGKAQVLVPQSPHAANPSADYIPPSHLAVSSAG